jgi:hypothetical protein
MSFRHYSHKKLEKVLSSKEVGHPQGCTKPIGFWISIGSAWNKWCKSEDWGSKGKKFIYRVKISRKAKIAWLKTTQDLIDFKRKYQDTTVCYGAIDWEKVYKDYQGIVILNPKSFSWAYYEDTTWCYSWDVPSGCIFDSSVVKIERIYK